ncbi:RnfH family protein, partial [Thiomicrorhabdus chilensis]
MHVSVVYAEQEQQWWLDVDLPEGATAIAAIHASGLLDLVEGID